MRNIFRCDHKVTNTPSVVAATFFLESRVRIAVFDDDGKRKDSEDESLSGVQNSPTDDFGVQFHKLNKYSQNELVRQTFQSFPPVLSWSYFLNKRATSNVVSVVYLHFLFLISAFTCDRAYRVYTVIIWCAMVNTAIKLSICVGLLDRVLRENFINDSLGYSCIASA